MPPERSRIAQERRNGDIGVLARIALLYTVQARLGVRQSSRSASAQRPGLCTAGREDPDTTWSACQDHPIVGRCQLVGYVA